MYGQVRSFGPSLEYFVRGLEIGNAVFTEFQGELGQHTTLDQRVMIWVQVLKDLYGLPWVPHCL